MQRLQRILLAVDFSPASEAALRQATYVAKVFASEVFLLHVIEQLPHAAATYQVMARRIHARLQRMRSTMIQLGVPVVHPPIVETGEAIEVILSTANQFGSNVIMLGSGNKRILERLRLGTTATKIIHQATRPVWVVKPSQTPLPIAKILCAVDFSEPSKRALRNAILLSHALGGELAVLHVIEDDVETLAAEQQTDALRLALQALLKDDANPHHAAQILIHPGETAASILQTVRDHRCDLLVMGSVGRRGLSGLFFGNTAEQVVREVPCSLLTVKGEDVLKSDGG